MSLLSDNQKRMYARYCAIRDAMEGDAYLSIKTVSEEFHVSRDQVRAVVMTQEDVS